MVKETITHKHENKRLGERTVGAQSLGRCVLNTENKIIHGSVFQKIELLDI